MRHLRRCIELDPKFDATLPSWAIYLRQDEVILAREHFRAAYEINPRESRYRAALRHKPDSCSASGVWSAAVSAQGRNSGDVRLAEL